MPMPLRCWRFVVESSVRLLPVLNSSSFHHAIKPSAMLVTLSTVSVALAQLPPNSFDEQKV